MKSKYAVATISVDNREYVLYSNEIYKNKNLAVNQVIAEVLGYAHTIANSFQQEVTVTIWRV